MSEVRALVVAAVITDGTRRRGRQLQLNEEGIARLVELYEAEGTPKPPG